jgi:hypothetical protein
MATHGMGKYGFRPKSDDTKIGKISDIFLKKYNENTKIVEKTRMKDVH